jgi:hypothetical protein
MGAAAAAAAQEGAKEGAAAAQEGAKWERRQRKREQKRERRQHKREQNGSGGSARGSKMGAAAAQEGAKEGVAAAQDGAKEGAAAAQEGAKWERRQLKREQNGSSMGSRGERIAGLLGLGSVFLEVFYCGGSFYGCAVYRELVLLYDIYLALMCAPYMLALPSATRVCSHVCRAVCQLPAVSCFRPPGVGVCGHAVRAAFLLSHGPHARFRVVKFLTRPTRGPRPPRRGCVATRFFFPDGSDHPMTLTE